MARKLSMFFSTHSHAFLLFLVIILNIAAMYSARASEADILVKFKESITNNIGLSNWNKGAPPCNGDHTTWIGVVCHKGSVNGLALQSLGLGGTIDVNALAQLQNLETVSLAGNNFTGQLPLLARLTYLKGIDFSKNMFSGEIPAKEFEGMVGLLKLDLQDNKFSGAIPASLADMPYLKELMLQNNGFQGEIPPFPEGQLLNFSAANNAFSGEIPLGVSHLPASAFEGNKDLCGEPLPLCKNSRRRPTAGTIIMVTVVMAAASTAVLVVIIILCRRRAPPQQPAEPATLAAADLDRAERGETASAAPSSPGGQQHQRKRSEPNVAITFLRENKGTFDMTDLLRASAEILGSGLFGSSYKAVVSDNQTVVVKRYRHMNNISKHDFQEHMRRLGRVNHPNVLPLVGFYYRREEKLLVYDFVDKSSLAAHLHGSRGHKCPDWATRLSITKGVARGLLCLYDELPSLTAAHGHLKSSNVLLDASNTPSLTDYGLVPIVNQEHAEQHMISYKSPEYKRTGRITKKTDVWSLGVLILEVLTGRFPANFLKQGKGGPDEEDTVAWVESVAKDEREGVDVFDAVADMARDKGCEGEMMKLLKLGFECCHVDVDMRPDIKEVAQQIEEVRERESDADLVVVD